MLRPCRKYLRFRVRLRASRMPPIVVHGNFVPLFDRKNYFQRIGRFSAGMGKLSRWKEKKGKEMGEEVELFKRFSCTRCSWRIEHLVRVKGHEWKRHETCRNIVTISVGMVPTGMSFIKRHLVTIPSSCNVVQWWHRSRDKFKGGNTSPGSKRPIIKLPLFLHCCSKRFVTVMLLSESAICPRDGQMER